MNVVPDEHTYAKHISQNQDLEIGNEQFPPEFGIRYRSIFYGSQHS